MASPLVLLSGWRGEAGHLCNGHLLLLSISAFVLCSALINHSDFYQSVCISWVCVLLVPTSRDLEGLFVRSVPGLLINKAFSLDFCAYQTGKVFQLYFSCNDRISGYAG